MHLIWRWIIFSAAVLLASHFVSGISVDPIYVALIVGVCLTFIFLVIKPVLNLLTLPINLLTLGLFSLVVNALIFRFLATLIPGFSVASWLAAFWGSLIVSVAGWLAKRFLKD